MNVQSGKATEFLKINDAIRNIMVKSKKENEINKKL